MMRRLAAAGLVSALPFLVASAGHQTFRSGVTMVRVDVSVTRGGTPVSGLSAADFEVRDNGVRQRVERVLIDEVPLSAYLILDSSQSVAGAQLRSLQSAAHAFLEGLAGIDKAALLTFSHQVRLLHPLSEDLRSVGREIDGVAGGGSTALVDALYAAIRLRDFADDRAVAVVFSDGLDNMSWLTPAEVIEAARRSDVIVYAVTLAPATSVPYSGPPLRNPSVSVVVDQARSEREARLPDNPVLRSLADQTGGRVFNAASSSQLTEVFVRALREIRARYVLTYYPEGVEQTGWHKLDVRLKGASGEVRARPGYFAAKSSLAPGPETQPPS